jgi:hypothetical protein
MSVWRASFEAFTAVMFKVEVVPVGAGGNMDP